MKIILKLIVVLSTLLVSASFVSCKEKLIEAEQLPATAQTFIKDYFPGSAISYVKKEGGVRAGYEVVMQDGTEIEFNGKGEWDNVDCKKVAVPAGLVPAGITEYVDKNCPGQIIVKIDKEHFGYEIELGNDLDLKFDKNGKFLRVDD